LLNTTFKREGPTRTLLGIAAELRGRLDLRAACLGAGGPVLDEMRGLDIPAWNLGMAFPLDLRGALRLTRLVRREKVDIVHLQLLRGEVIGTLAAAHTPEVSVVVVVHNTDPYRDPGRSPVRAMLSRWALGRADSVVAVSRGVAEFVTHVQRVPAHRVTVIPNGVDVPALSEHRSGYPVIGTAGRLDEQKGLDVLLTAMPKVVAQVPTARLRIAGTGPLDRSLRSSAARLGLGGTVEFAGFLEDMEQFWSSIGVFVLPSRWEGMPFVLLDAMARGVPVVVTDVPGSGEIVRDGVDGLVVPRDDPTLLAGALVRVLQDQRLAERVGAAGRERVVGHYTTRVMADAYAALYRDTASMG
jgi:glycosyltransferase involved in cell wall biosynthesis